jgi:hypothetical protein
MNERDRDFADAARVIDDSVVMRVLSSVRRAFQATLFVGRPFQGRRSPHIWILTIAAGCLTHALLLQWMPDRIAPVKPLAYGMVVAFGAFALVSGFITSRSSATATADSSAGTAKTRKSSRVE